ncbi:MAG: deoxyguanosinetriphosphate triphosphohydrolase [Dongiaceae bacterium]
MSFSYAPYACNPAQSRGRFLKEPAPKDRSEFQRDRDRIIHSAAFRKLEYKTQVFVNHEGDYYRTRLTHSLEVGQITRSICRALELNEDLAEAIALAHDLGHTPFGHAGEEALNEAMQPFGGFDHNDQTLRVLTYLESRYAQFHGLNLTWETLEGVVKHNGPKTGKLPPTIKAFNEKYDLALSTFPSLEAQVAALADDIAYCNHDIDDGLNAGLFSLEDLKGIKFIRGMVEAIQKRHPKIEEKLLIAELVRDLIGVMVNDVLAETRMRLKATGADNVEKVRHAKKLLVDFSPQQAENNQILKEFLMKNMYRHWRVNRMTSKARRIVKDLFGLLIKEPECMPTEWRARIDEPTPAQTALVVADYIAGMTDRFAIEEHQRLFDLYKRS